MKYSKWSVFWSFDLKKRPKKEEQRHGGQVSIAALYSIKTLSLDKTLPSFSHKENPPSTTQSAALIDYQTPKRGDIFDGGPTDYKPKPI